MTADTTAAKTVAARPSPLEGAFSDLALAHDSLDESVDWLESVLVELKARLEPVRDLGHVEEERPQEELGNPAPATAALVTAVWSFGDRTAKHTARVRGLAREVSTMLQSLVL